MAVALAVAGGTVPEEWIRPGRKVRGVVEAEAEAPSLAERMRGAGVTRGPQRLGVLKCNWLAYQVLLSCQFTYVGMSGVCIGVSASELERAMGLHQVPRTQARQVRRDVELMARVAANEIRRQQEAAQKRS